MSRTVLPPLETMTGYRRAHAILSSSPPRSSSPPGTPYSSRHSHHHPYIQSSPTLGSGIELAPLQYRSDDPPSLWIQHESQLPVSPKQPQYASFARPKYAFEDETDLPPSSEFDIGDPRDDAEMSLPEMDSETTSESTPGHGSTYFSDSEEEGVTHDGEGDDGFGYGNGGFRATFFRVSAERGQWKDDPLALKATTTAGLPRIPLRQSMPTLSRPSSVEPSVTARPISEPVESSKPPEACLQVPGDQDRVDNGLEVTAEKEPSPALLDGPLSRLTSPAPSAKELTPECDGNGRYSSPLPPSSPPLSPMSGCLPSLSRSVSPLSFAPSSPMSMPPLSPRIEPPPLSLEEPPTHDANLDVSSSPVHEAQVSLTDDAISSDPIDKTSSLELETPSKDLTSPGLPKPQHAVAEPQSSPPPPSSAEAARSSTDPVSPSVELQGAGKQRSATPEPSASSSKQKSKSKSGLKSSQTQSDNDASTKSKSLKRKQPQAASQAPSKKQRVASEPASTSEANRSQKTKKLAKTPQADDDDAMAEDELPQAGPSKTKARKKQTRRSRAPQFLHDSPQKVDPADGPAEPFDEELKGMLIECMATSRASSMAVSVLCRTVLQTHPYLKEQKTEKEWRKVVNRILYTGMAPRGSGVFGKVDSSGKDDSDRPLEAQWFYVPEMDEDQDRAALIRSMMPRPAKRSETKKYKQYYWRPLDKISRWDPEDDL
ncbi:hypothetical protein CC2G_009567 [Coprinopsis cinerea AmutBmut pab1-1]|nr:hypothetical protein CC2G_009567 [Coprinopsis cinerea AmutBmut pab1-1]